MHGALQTKLLGAFAVVALLLAAVGLHGMLAYSAEQRRFQFGIRLALGADPARPRRLILWEGMKSAGAGSAIGIIGAFALTCLLQSLLFGVRAADPVVFTAVPLVLVLVALLASYLPTGRISAIDLARLMRNE